MQPRKSHKNRQTVVLMPDLFLDHFVSFGDEVKELVSAIYDAARRGGGNILVGTQQIRVGGNAANCAIACSRLGLSSTLVARVQGGLSQFLLQELACTGVDTSHISLAEKSPLTVAFEVGGSTTKTNLMFSSSGYIGSFGPEALARRDWQAIRDAHVVGIFNWSQNRKGTDLAEQVFKEAKRSGAITYLDCGDLSNRQAIDTAGLVERVISSGLVDHLSLNESEALILAQVLKMKQDARFSLASFPRELEEACSAEIDLHTVSYSSVVSEGRVYSVPSFDVQARRATGAGDAWNAGNIYGIVHEHSPLLRLLFANAAAAVYLSSRKGIHGDTGQIRGFLRRRRLVGTFERR